jgi:NAD+ kinase
MPGVPEAVFFRQSEFIVVLGGDGTMLRAAQMAARTNTPLLGVNLGALGYLTDVEKNEEDEAFQTVLADHCRLEKRMMLETETHPWLALNDICVERGFSSKLIRVRLQINEEYIDTIRADGIIVSTPTGSTAYNLAAGGPILKPESEMMVVTAICPHTLYLRPWVISAADTVRVTVLDTDAKLAMDGQNRAKLAAGDEIAIRRSAYYTTIMKTKASGFFEILRRKMRVGIDFESGEAGLGDQKETRKND